jgi:hypothetical protein
MTAIATSLIWLATHKQAEITKCLYELQKSAQEFLQRVEVFAEGNEDAPDGFSVKIINLSPHGVFLKRIDVEFLNPPDGNPCVCEVAWPSKVIRAYDTHQVPLGNLIGSQIDATYSKGFSNVVYLRVIPRCFAAGRDIPVEPVPAQAGRGAQGSLQITPEI